MAEDQAEFVAPWSFSFPPSHPIALQRLERFPFEPLLDLSVYSELDSTKECLIIVLDAIIDSLNHCRDSVIGHF
jgi:hypothetical protein